MTATSKVAAINIHLYFIIFKFCPVLMHPILVSIENKFYSINSDKDIITLGGLKENSTYVEYKGNIDWSLFENAHVLNWGNLESGLITETMRTSVLSSYDSLYIQIGYGEKVLQVSPDILINHWEEVLHASVEGFPVMTPDKKYYFEMLYNPKVIYSNFHL